MTAAQRILVNTTAQYTRTIINVCLSLYSTRLILAALGQTDFGIYNVVAGVIAMLSFMTGALVATTQRYLSYNHGSGDTSKIYQIFGNSLLLHLFIGIGILILLSALAYPTIHHFLNIENSRYDAATHVYFAAALMLFLSFLTAPFRAVFIARENIIYISVIDVLDGILKLLIAIFLTHIVSFDKLTAYAIMLTGISVFNLLAFAIYAFIHFEECHIPHIKEWDKQQIKELSSFASWTIYQTGCVIVRTQGIAVVLNRMFGSIINAAYGIAQQVQGAILFVSDSIYYAMGPQIVKAEGRGERKHMLLLAETACKFAYILLSTVVIPLIIEMPTILRLWLSSVPDYAVMFCRFILIASLCNQLTEGLGNAIRAIGRIKNYSIGVNTIKVLTLPAAWLCLHFGLPVVSVMWCYLIFEIICALCRLPFLKHEGGLNIWQFVSHVILPIIPPTIIILLVNAIITHYCSWEYRFVLTFVISGITACLAYWFLAISRDEKQIFKNIIISKIYKNWFRKDKQ